MFVVLINLSYKKLVFWREKEKGSRQKFSSTNLPIFVFKGWNAILHPTNSNTTSTLPSLMYSDASILVPGVTVDSGIPLGEFDSSEYIYSASPFTVNLLEA